MIRSAHRPTTLSHPLPHRQQGVMLLISMIALIALTMGGIAFMRSVDTGKLMAGNMAFSRASVAFTDVGMEAARTQLAAIALDTTCGAAIGQCLWTNQVTSGGVQQTNYWAQWQAARYDASSQVIAGSGFDYQTEASWATALAVPSPAPGYTIRYIIHRMCMNTGTSVGNTCVLDPNPVAVGGGLNMGAVDYGNNLNQGISSASDPTPYYRVTIRVDGPRNSLTYVQVWMA
jgi:type IV pilus assembly protein PilX